MFTTNSSKLLTGVGFCRVSVLILLAFAGVCFYRLNMFSWCLSGRGMFEQSGMIFQQTGLILNRCHTNEVWIPANSIEMKENVWYFFSNCNYPVKPAHKNTSRSTCLSMNLTKSHWIHPRNKKKAIGIRKGFSEFLFVRVFQYFYWKTT